MDEENKNESSRVDLALAQSRVGVAHATVVIDDTVERTCKDVIRVGIAGGVLYSCTLVNPLLVFGGLIAAKLTTSAASRRAQRQLPKLESRMEEIKAHLKRIKAAKAQLRPEDVQPQHGTA